MVELPDDAIEAAARAMALVDEENGCFERLDEFDAITDPLEAEDYIRAHGYPHGDREDCEYWRRRARAAFEVIAARVRAEAVAEHRAEQRHWIEVGQQIEAEKRVAEAERDEYRRNWQEAEKRTAQAVAEATDELNDLITTLTAESDEVDETAVAEAVAAERQRIKATVWTQRGLLADREHTLAVVNRIIDAAGSVPVATPQRPEIVVLCGSTRFKDAFRGAAKAEALAGRIVLTVSDLDPRPEARHVNVPIDAETKALLDDLHKRKIDLAERVLVLNVGGYIGESTRSEIEYATALGKPINYLETDPCRCPDCAASPVLVGHPEPWFRETPESLALLEAERAEVAAVEARAGRPPGDRETFDRRAGEEEAQAELLGHRPAVGETAEQPEER